MTDYVFSVVTRQHGVAGNGDNIMADLLFCLAFIIPTIIWVVIADHINDLKTSRDYWRKRAIQASHGIHE